jgi:hypothetical protein
MVRIEMVDLTVWSQGENPIAMILNLEDGFHDLRKIQDTQEFSGTSSGYESIRPIQLALSQDQ